VVEWVGDRFEVELDGERANLKPGSYLQRLRDERRLGQPSRD
jgi:hypothetical protein